MTLILGKLSLWFRGNTLPGYVILGPRFLGQLAKSAPSNQAGATCLTAPSAAAGQPLSHGFGERHRFVLCVLALIENNHPCHMNHLQSSGSGNFL